MMKGNNQLAGSFVKEFPDPTFFQQPRSKRLVRLQSIQAEINIVKEDLEPVYMKPPGFVDFFLEDLATGKGQSFIQPAVKKGK